MKYKARLVLPAGLGSYGEADIEINVTFTRTTASAIQGDLDGKTLDAYFDVGMHSLTGKLKDIELFSEDEPPLVIDGRPPYWGPPSRITPVFDYPSKPKIRPEKHVIPPTAKKKN